MNKRKNILSKSVKIKTKMTKTKTIFRQIEKNGKGFIISDVLTKMKMILKLRV